MGHTLDRDYGSFLFDGKLKIRASVRFASVGNFLLSRRGRFGAGFALLCLRRNRNHDSTCLTFSVCSLVACAKVALPNTEHSHRPDIGIANFRSSFGLMRGGS